MSWVSRDSEREGTGADGSSGAMPPAPPVPRSQFPVPSSRSVFPTALERRIALRYLRGRKKSGATALNTRIAMAGVAIGVAALILVLGIVNGLHDDLRDKILVGNPHIHVLTYGANL